MNDKVLYCAVRKPNDGWEYLDFSTLAGTSATARELAEWHERDNRAWAKANPVVRTAKVRITEIEEAQ